MEDKTIQEIIAKFAEKDVKISAKDIKAKVTKYESLRVPEKEMIRSITNAFAKEKGIKFDYTGSGNRACTIDKMNEDGKWGTLRVRVKELWESKSDAVAQTGLIGDGTGIKKFTIFRKNQDLAIMEPDKCYEIQNCTTSSFQDRLSINLNKTSIITEIDDEIEIVQKTIEVTGLISKVKPGSGLIKRCPECKKTLNKGSCETHGKPEKFNYDIRVMAVLETMSGKSHDILMNREVTEKFFETTLDAEIEKATEQLDPLVVRDNYTNNLAGKFVMITATEMPDMCLVNTISIQSKVDENAVKTAIELCGGN